MLNVFPRRRWRSPHLWLGILGCLSSSLLVLSTPTLGQAPSTKARPSRAGARAPEKPKTSAPAAKAQAEAAPPAPAPDAANPPAADPSQTRKFAPNEIFKDPNAEQILDIKKYPEQRVALPSRAEIDQVKADAGNPNAIPDRALIERVVQGLAAQLTVHKNIQALIDPPVKENPADAQAIQSATTNLLEPLFLARSAHNPAFLTIYQRALRTRLEPLLKNHLIPRVQAMIILGESGNPDALDLYENQIRDPKQTLWVKLWALEGITNIVQNGGRLTVDAESRAAKIISDFLENTQNQDLPWPVKLRALEALGALRQGFLPTQPKSAHMANTAMLFLVDPDAKLEVRAEAARTLGLMQINAAVPKYNFALVAHATGQLAADLGTAIDSTFSAKPPRADNLTKARYLTALLIGPVYEAFDGVPTQRDSGLLHTIVNPANAYVQRVFDLIKPVAQTSVQLLGAPTNQYIALKKTLETQIAALRDFLGKNPPPDRHLVQGGRDYPEPQAAGAWLVAPLNPLAGLARGR